MLESTLEKKLARFAKDNGVLTYKFVCPSNRGVPDRIFIGPAGVLFLELKVGSNKPTKLQLHHIGQIREHGGIADWCNDFETGKEMILRVCLL